MTDLMGKLSWTWEEAGPDAHGTFHFMLINEGPSDWDTPRLSLSMLARLTKDAVVQGAKFAHRLANHHEFALPNMSAGTTHRISAAGLSYRPSHFTDGPKSAYIETKAGAIIPLTLDPAPEKTPAKPALRTPPLDPLGVTPRPASVNIAAWRDGAITLAAGGSDAENVAYQDMRTLAARLFPHAQQSGPQVDLFFEQQDARTRGYKATFTHKTITIDYATPVDLRHGLVTVMQIVTAQAQNPADFRIPEQGAITDHAGHPWRGCHLDVARHFMGPSDLSRFIDILAWLKFNVLHLHLTDDEGWRLDIPDIPALTATGAWRGPGLPLPGQHGFIAQRYGGFYTVAELTDLVAHAQRLGVEIMPEIDTPGHCYAALVACPDLHDGDEPPGAYTSFQGYPNNALNPGVAQLQPFLETVFGTVADIFPVDIIHVGGDELAGDAWAKSPAARQAARAQNLASTADLFGAYLHRIRDILQASGKRIGVWDDAALCGAVSPGEALVFAWQDAAQLAALCAQGHQVIATPGQAYYLDMAQSEEWGEPGLGWGGTVRPQDTYGFDAPALVPDGDHVNLAGVQASIWSENLISNEMFNHMVFPRLGAVAEGAWTPRARKNWRAFAAGAGLLPRL